MAGDRSLLHRWEELEIGKQFVIAYPVMIVVIAVIHWTLLNQPAFRGALYGLFWALPAAGVIAIASQNEGRKRRDREREARERGDA
jgi:hypothetical protein